MSINKSHAKNRDKFLDQNGPEEVSAGDAKNAIVLKHEKDKDTTLDLGGANEISAASIKAGLTTVISSDIDPNVDSLAELDGVNGATSIIDLTGNLTWSIDGAGSLDTSVSKFGISSLNLGGDLRANIDTNFNLQLSNSISVGMFIKFDTVPTGKTGIYTWNLTPTTYTSFEYHPTTGWRSLYRNSGTFIYDQSSGGAGLINDTNWHHVVFSKQSTNFHIYVDGVRVLQYSYTSHANMTLGTLRIGGGEGGIGTASADAHIDNLVVGPNYFGEGGASITVPTLPVVDTNEMVTVFAGNNVLRYTNITLQQLTDLVETRLDIPTGIDQATAGATAGQLWSDSSDGFTVKLGQ